MNSLSEKLIKIASSICEKYGDIKGNSACQDFDVAEINPLSFFTENERKQIMYEYEQMNSCGADYTEDSHNQMSDGMVCGYAISESLNSELMQNKIKLTKKLPTEEGYYFFKPKGDPVKFVKADLCRGKLYAADGSHYFGLVDDLVGHWAKVDQSMFEVVDDETD